MGKKKKAKAKSIKLWYCEPCWLNWRTEMKQTYVEAAALKWAEAFGDKMNDGAPDVAADEASSQRRPTALGLGRDWHVKLPHLRAGRDRASRRQALCLEVPALGQAPSSPPRSRRGHAAELPRRIARLASSDQGARSSLGECGLRVHVLRAERGD